jgi:hypothetical protein
MTVDVNVKNADTALLEEIDEIMEDTMVQLFILQPRTAEALEAAKEAAEEHAPIFYCVPLSMRDEADSNCIGYYLDAADSLPVSLDQPLFVDSASLDDALSCRLREGGYRGIILDATHTHDDLENFHLSIGPGNVGTIDAEALSKLSMDRIVLHSGYPDAGFESIYATAKRISDTMFRPEQSIIARATQSSLLMFGFKKG